MTRGKRLDVAAVELGLFASRELAQAAIMDGGVLVDGHPVTKPGTAVPQTATITIAAGWGPPRYVSRGGLKLEKALEVFHVCVRDRICLDIGSSTGGFTDCLLRHGAARVYAVDVGYGQLAWSLRQDKRVVVKERLNARALTPELVYKAADDWADLATVDVSFISILKILPAVLRVTRVEKLDLICLIKPQFEAGRAAVGKGGVVRSPEIHVNVITHLIDRAENLGLYASSLTWSPLKGPAGNIEYLIHWRTSKEPGHPDIAAVVAAAHNELG